MQQRISHSILKLLQARGSLRLDELLGGLSPEYPDLPVDAIAAALRSLIESHAVCPAGNRFSPGTRDECLRCGKASLTLNRNPAHRDD
jgi:hypothetical protein